MLRLTNWLKKSVALSSLVEMATTGVQWVGWLWAVCLGEQSANIANRDPSGAPTVNSPVPASITMTGSRTQFFGSSVTLSAEAKAGIASNPLKYLIVPVAIIANELVCCQIFGRLQKKIEGTIISEHTSEKLSSIFFENWSSWIKYLKTGVSSAVAGVTFYLVDDAVLAACTRSGYGLPATLALRCLAVMVADRIVFHLACETFDAVKLKKFGAKLIPNAQLAINAGTAAIGYTLTYAIGESICDANNIKNPWVKSVVITPLIFLGTALSPILSYAEKRLFWRTNCYKFDRVAPELSAQDEIQVTVPQSILVRVASPSTYGEDESNSVGVRTEIATRNTLRLYAPELVTTNGARSLSAVAASPRSLGL